jgi:hypothetical protein
LSNLAPLTLWSDVHRTRFFLIPDDQQLPSGDFVIHTITGRKLSLDAAGLTSFEITEIEARKWLESQLGNMLDGARGAFERLVDRLTGADQDRLSAVRAAVEQLENALSRLETAAITDTPVDIKTLKDCADHVTRIADRLRSFARVKGL